MAIALLTPADLAPFAPDLDQNQAEAMIGDATAMAYLLAPCLPNLDPGDHRIAAAKAIVRAAILRWHDAGNGVQTTDQQTGGPFTNTVTTQARTSMFWKSDETKLRALCGGGKAFALDTIPDDGGREPDWWGMSARETLPVTVLEEPCVGCGL